MPESHGGNRFTFRLPSTPSDLRIISRRAVPARIGLSGDTRTVGMNLRQITLRSGSVAISVNAADGSLTGGFHEVQGGHRWTDGDAIVPSELLAGLTGPVALEIEAEGLALSA